MAKNRSRPNSRPNSRPKNHPNKSPNNSRPKSRSDSRTGTPHKSHNSTNNEGSSPITNSGCVPPESSLTPQTLLAFEEALEDVHTRFVLNLPPEELSSTDRIFFQLEQAYWFYDDFHCDDTEADSTKPSLPRYGHLRPFALKMFEISPLLEGMRPNFDKMWAEFGIYKRKISTYGTVLLNEDCTQVVLCQSWGGNSWTFPAGKVNQNERGIEAAVRETYEETGFDINCKEGYTRVLKHEADEAGTTVPWEPIQDEDKLHYVEDGSGKRRFCFVCKGVPEDFPFEPVARKEVSEVAWHDISDLPRKSFAVLPFVSQLKKWIRKNNRVHSSRKRDRKEKNTEKSGGGGQQHVVATTTAAPSNNDATTTTSTPIQNRGREDTNTKNNTKQHSNNKSAGRDGSNRRTRSRSGSFNSKTRGKVREDDPITLSSLAKPGDDNGWTEEDMFHANELLLGRKIEYDGNPHLFSDCGFAGGVDPHAFRVVGGKFLNDACEGGGVGRLAKPPEVSKLQPLFRRGSEGGGGSSVGTGGDSTAGGGDGDEDFVPFFSGDGATPWGEVVDDLKQEYQGEDDDDDGNIAMGSISSALPFGGGSNKSGLALLKMLRGGDSSFPQGDDDEEEDNYVPIGRGVVKEENMFGGSMVLPQPIGSDVSLSQGVSAFLTDAEITARSQQEKAASLSISANDKDDHDEGVEEEKEDHWEYLQNWVQNLERPPPTKMFGDFRFDVDAIMNAMEMVGS
uniref:Nudix hydrolase domain-containing protein n=1 Tax=Ditylum brightwellii TaxID=49249 RepID=A0A7S4RWC6_9STRA|mmetsp:Transcript_34306/g.51766  ORF Transcript_34306/g.51766 Transcript_34306/m.51766 type:complete len:734 (+) Transcript_34306:74-2275(+)